MGKISSERELPASDGNSDPNGHAPKKRARRMKSAGVIIEAATTLFLRNGYQSTSMDDIAELARVSKQTIYTHVKDKQNLFGSMVESAARRADDLIDAIPVILRDATNVETSLAELSRRLIDLVFQPRVLQMRRLAQMESVRFPDVARNYFKMAQERTRRALAAGFKELGEKGLLRVENPDLAADHFSALVLMIPVDKAMFGETVKRAEIERFADAGIRVFVAAYGAP